MGEPIHVIVNNAEQVKIAIDNNFIVAWYGGKQVHEYTRKGRHTWENTCTISIRPDQTQLGIQADAVKHVDKRVTEYNRQYGLNKLEGDSEK